MLLSVKVFVTVATKIAFAKKSFFKHPASPVEIP
jgi:hypothetical protein